MLIRNDRPATPCPKSPRLKKGLRPLSSIVRIGLPLGAALLAIVFTATTLVFAVWAQSGAKTVPATSPAGATDRSGQLSIASRGNGNGTQVRTARETDRPSGGSPAIAVSPAAAPTAADNDYTRINDAVHAINSGGTITLTGTFNWTEPNAAASWALGNDGVAATGDDYSILVPANRNGVTFTATSLGAATIQGPGDLAAFNLEGVFLFDGTGVNQGWTISKIRFLDFDLPIAMFADALGDFDNTHITNNYIRLARDLNATVAPADANQNVGIYFSFGANQVIAGNTIEIQGDGVSDTPGAHNATDIGMQCDTGSTNSSEGLEIRNNLVRILRAQSADPGTVVGIWENGNVQASNIAITGNRFVNQGTGNNPAANRQRGFRVTSHSSGIATVSYASNTVIGANIGFEWAAGPDYTGFQAVEMTGNTINNNGTGVLVRNHGSANLSFNRIVGNIVGINNVDGGVFAQNNWWGCNAGPSTVPCDTATGAVDYNPWIVLGIDASPNAIEPGGSAKVTADMTHNSNGSVPSAKTFVPSVAVAFTATQGTMTPPVDVISSGQASSIFTSTSGTGAIVSAMVDSQTVSTPIAVSSPSFAIDDVTLAEGNAGTTAFVFTVTKTGTTELSSTVSLETQDSTATVANNDYLANAEKITFAPGDTTKQVTVLVNGDSAVEANEAFFVNLTASTNGSIGDGQGVGTILNDDATQFLFSISDAKVVEGNSGTSNLVFTVTYAAAPSNSTVGSNPLVHYHTSDGTATAAGNDYVPVQDGVVDFGIAASPNGIPSRTITIVVNGDTNKESNEFLYVTLDMPQGGSIGRGPGAGIIVDEDRSYVADLNHDQMAEFTVFRPSEAVWYTLQFSNDNTTNQTFGLPTDQPVPGDYDGDGMMDYAVRRPGVTNLWVYQSSSDLAEHKAGFGIDTDLSVQADYDGDGKTDVAVFRDGNWFILQSSDGEMKSVVFGIAGDIPVPGDFDGDAKADYTVFRSGAWYTLRSSDGSLVSQTWGQAGDKPLAGDFDGDGRFDYSVFRNGDWYMLESLSGEARGVNWGLTNDIPVVADYDGDGTSDVAVFRPSEGNWYVVLSSDDSVRSLHWGQNGDIPIPSAYLP
jgi:hypothetical protein